MEAVEDFDFDVTVTLSVHLSNGFKQVFTNLPHRVAAQFLAEVRKAGIQVLTVGASQYHFFTRHIVMVEVGL